MTTRRIILTTPVIMLIMLSVMAGVTGTYQRYRADIMRAELDRGDTYCGDRTMTTFDTCLRDGGKYTLAEQRDFNESETSWHRRFANVMFTALGITLVSLLGAIVIPRFRVR